MSTIYEINPDGSASVAEPKSKRAGAAILGSALLAAQPPDDALAELRRRYYAIAKDDGYRASNPNKPVPLDERVAACESELAAVRSAGEHASGRAADILRIALDALTARRAMLRGFASEVAGAESAYRSALAAHGEAQRALNMADPSEVAALMIELERCKASMRKALRAGNAACDAFSHASKPVLPALAIAKASVERVRQLDEERSREIASRGEDIASLCEALES